MLLNIGSVNNSDKRYATITPLTSPNINPNIFENIPSTIVILSNFSSAFVKNTINWNIILNIINTTKKAII